MDIVKEVLERQQLQNSKYKSINVEKHLDCKIDVGMMLCTDPNDLELSKLKSDDMEEYLLSLTRDNTQLLINEIWKLPTERVEECIVANLPEPTTSLPRLRKAPGPKPMTKWEKFAKEKGIKKKSKDKKVFDQVLNKWVPTYGFKRADAEKERDWVLEVPKNVDPNEDMFQRKVDLRSEKVAKNEIQRMRNIVRAKKEAAPRSGYLGVEAASSQQLLTAASVAKGSTASIGKFQEKLPKEKQARGLGVKELIPGTKRKASHIVQEGEKTANLDLIKSILNKKPKIDIEKAIKIQKDESKAERESGESTPGGKKGKGKKKGSNKTRSKTSRKPKGGQGQRAPGKKLAIGRKRR